MPTIAKTEIARDAQITVVIDGEAVHDTYFHSYIDSENCWYTQYDIYGNAAYERTAVANITHVNGERI